MTRADMKNKVRWIIADLGGQWLPDSSSSQYDLVHSLAEGITQYCLDLECYRAQYSLVTLAPIYANAAGTAGAATLHLTACSVTSGTITAGMRVMVAGDNTVYYVSENATITASAATVTLTTDLLTSPTSARAYFTDPGLYEFSSFTSPNDPTGVSGTVNGSRIFNVIGMTYDGKPLHPWDETDRAEKARFAGNPHYYEENYDWHTVRLDKPPIYARTLTIDGNVILDPNVFLNISDSTDPAWPANLADQETPCFWAAKEVLLNSPEPENQYRIKKAEDLWTAKLAEARSRLKKRNTPLHMRRRGCYGDVPMFPDGVRVNELPGLDLDYGE